jgi:hypothetical protein
MTCLGISDIIALAGVIIAIITLIVTVRIARMIPQKDKLSHRKHIREVVRKLTREMESGRNHMCKIIDIDRFENLYPDNFNSHNRQSHFKAELDGNDIHGVIFIDSNIGIKKDKEGRFVACYDDSYTDKAAAGGMIPYEWIIDIDESGDETDSSAIFYCRFGKKRLKIGQYFVKDEDVQLKRRFGIYQCRSPFKSRCFFFLDKATNKVQQHIQIKVGKVRR